MSFSVLALILSAIITRFLGIFWGNSFFFHPDENNMISAVMRMSPGELNPHFFAYGQFPLYLGFLTQRLLGVPHTFAVTAHILRFWSAIFSLISVGVFYILAKKLFSKRISKISTAFYIFTPGLIQLAHYGTTESLLVLIFIINLYLSFLIYEKPLYYKAYIFAFIATGIGLASKLSSLIFITPILFVSLVNFIKTSSKMRITLITSYGFLLALLLFIILSPYNMIERADFLSALRYETEVATGRMPVFYTSQFSSTTPYLFQVLNIFPYVLGIPLYAFSILGLITLQRKLTKYWVVILFSSFVYFAYFGQLYVKWTRFMSPVFFLFPLLAAYLISQVKNKYIATTLFTLTIVPGIVFMNQYIKPDIRVVASEWINSNISQQSSVLSEGGNVVDIPLGAHSVNLTNFDFYSLEDSQLAKEMLIDKISTADYLIIPSRRVFMSQRGEDFPVTTKYYLALFSGRLGFKPLKTFTRNTDILLDQEKAEETWSVFDRPTIRIYKKVTQLELNEYEELLSP